jgi:hypothetical protein
MRGGAIAYYYLKEHKPEIITKVVKTLEQHPWYNTEWKEKLDGLTGEDRDVTPFMLASTFPDDARKDAAPFRHSVSLCPAMFCSLRLLYVTLPNPPCPNCGTG